MTLKHDELFQESVTEEQPMGADTEPEGENATASAEQDQAAKDQKKGDYQGSPPAPDASDAEGAQEEEQDGDDAAADEDEGGEEQPKSKPRSGVQKRIDELTRGRHTAQRALEMAEAENARLRAQLEGKAPATPEDRKDPAEGAPKPEQFTSYEDYMTALARYEAKQTVERERQASREAQAKAAQDAARDKFLERTETAREKYADYDEVVTSSRVPVSAHLLDAIMDSEHGPDLAYYLASNTKEAERIAVMHPISAIRELGKIEAKFEAEAKRPATNKATKAPDPINPVGGKGGSAVKDPAKMTMPEYIAWRKKHAKSAA